MPARPRLHEFHGKPCPYCNRLMDRSCNRLGPSRDHFVPRFLGGIGGTIVICCKFCNGLKGHMRPAEWNAFRKAFEGYWNFSARKRREALATFWRTYRPGPKDDHSVPAAARSFTFSPSGRYCGMKIVVPPALIFKPRLSQPCGEARWPRIERTKARSPA